ncbi:YfiT family bacillithiol transferase [Bacillus sp. MRMR6]|uniref:YfiT family bacillithiol transferase n=1 Tax=Bacillus sp. MRMR6 TaxID=1928617 RepID=UPI000951CAA4|nr:putative metal-dependent hydrolase [Bacillus sp. MRMR6]OLS33970.1 metal-dependent hydrolase [Bacillus sp. MRMR6]
MENLHYPIGLFTFEGEPTTEVVEGWIHAIEAAPAQLREAVKDLRDDQLDTAYRPEGWTVRQVVHHIADSHMNAYIRLKLALTEENPVIKPYREEKWAELSDSSLPIEISLELLEAVHKRWIVILRQLQPAALEKTFIHPDAGVTKISMYIGMYAWHGQHHIAHITSLIDRLKW